MSKPIGAVDGDKLEKEIVFQLEAHSKRDTCSYTIEQYEDPKFNRGVWAALDWILWAIKNGRFSLPSAQAPVGRRFDQNEIVAYCPMEYCEADIRGEDLLPEIQALLSQPSPAPAEITCTCGHLQSRHAYGAEEHCFEINCKCERFEFRWEHK